MGIVPAPLAYRPSTGASSVPLGQYGPRYRLLLCRGASGSVEVTHTRCLTDTWSIGARVSCLLARRMPSEQRGERILIWAGDNVCQV